MEKLKFEECFLKSQSTYISVEKLKVIYDQLDGEYEQHYRGDLYCPECYSVQLSFHPNAKTPHFRTQGTHKEDCSYNFEPANQRQMKEYLENQWNHDEIETKLKACLNLLFNTNPLNSTKIADTFSSKLSKDTDQLTINVGPRRKSIPRKKLSTPFSKDDYGNIRIFYGTVIVDWDLRREDIKYIRLRDIEKNSLICSISLSNNVYKHMNEAIKFDEPTTCNVAFFATMVRKKINTIIV